MRTVADPAKAWETKSFKHDKVLTTCKYTPAGDAVLAGSFDGKIYRWAVESGERSVVGTHGTWISVILPGPNDRLYSADFQGNVKAWENSKEIWKVETSGWLKAMALSPDGALLATGGRDAVVRLWSTKDGKLVKELKGHTRDIYSATFHPDGKSLATGDYDGKILHWDVATGKLARTLDAGLLLTRNSDFLCDVGGVRALGFDKEGKRLAATGLRDAKSNTFCPGSPAGIVFEWESGKALTTLKGKDEKIDGGIIAVRFLDDGTLAGCAESQSTGAIWFWKPGESEPFHAIGGQSLYEIDLHPDGVSLAGVFFQPIGHSGNGRGEKKGDYKSHGGNIRLFSMTEKPKSAQKPAKK